MSWRLVDVLLLWIETTVLGGLVGAMTWVIFNG